MVRLELVEIKYYKKRTLKRIHILILILIFIILIMTIAYAIMKRKTNQLQNIVMANIEAQENDQELLAESEEQGRTEIELPNLTEEAKNKIKHIYRSDEKVAYLTFDDGPSSTVTPFVLDILKDNNIKATFFPLGKQVEAYPEIVKRAYQEGHYIANHGYSHVYKQIYETPEKVLEEYQKTEVAIQNAIGIPEYHTHVIRFPGGSKGNKYEETIAQAINLLEQNNITYVDWNCLTGDSVGKNDKEAMLQELANTSYGKNSVVILMHDASNKILTYEVLQDAINYLKEQGYTFKNFYDLME